MKRLTPASLSLLMFLAVGGLVAAYVGKNLLAKDEAPAVEIKNLPMALSDAEPGTVLTAAYVGVGRIPADKITPEMLLNKEVVIGRMVKKAIKAGSPFTPDMLYPPNYRPPLQVADGMVAVSVDVAGTSDMVDGLIVPGHYVDVHLTVSGTTVGDPGSSGLTMTLFKGVHVLAVNGTGGGLSRGGNTVTLELTPKQANVMILAKDRAKVTLTYNPAGKGTGVVDVPEEDRVTLEQILGLKPAPEPEPPFTSEHYGRSQRSVIRWKDGERVDGYGGLGFGDLPGGEGLNSGNGGGGRRYDSRSGAGVAPRGDGSSTKSSAADGPSA